MGCCSRMEENMYVKLDCVANAWWRVFKKIEDAEM